MGLFVEWELRSGTPSNEIRCATLCNEFRKTRPQAASTDCEVRQPTPIFRGRLRMVAGPAGGR